MGQQGYDNYPVGAGMTQVAPGSPQQVVYVVQDDAFVVPRQDPSQLDYTVRLKSPNAIGVLHDAPISDSWKFWPCYFLGPNCWCWLWLKKRTYVRVLEDSVEAEYPFVCAPFCCTECCVCQYNTCTHRKVFFHSCVAGSVKPARCCTPYHCCCCIACFGEVVSFAPCDAVNCFLCCCLLHYVPGLADSERFARAAKTAKSQWEAGRLANDTNLRPTAFLQNGAVQMTAPPTQAMMGGPQMVASAPNVPGGARNAW
ncbi:hypothetical protein KFL_003690080 [Klebsormidium nitens]|uniref:PLAC8 family protein n=1 Tax=Klebsormidium nitens TaxID=105231 RepID=A0A1Y1IG15_KLENI|nr:hypothetical protein KFL_003690080 [Klebsormidium nitens]|eukprot:GAQ87677.1 hypothetical protein KFL_003690080 [Klebsormidium nitens]